MAGSGDPYAVLTPLRLRLLRALHDGATVAGLAAEAGLSPGQVRTELAPLRVAHLIAGDDDRPRPTFVVAGVAETRRVAAHAAGVGRLLAERLLDRWPATEAAYRQLALAAAVPLPDVAFLLVGDRVLDVGLLDALARDGRLMPPAAARPSPGRPDARYYLWLIEGEHDQLGRYGQRVINLPWRGWELLTFGQYTLGDAPNAARDALEAAAQAAVAAGDVRTPEDLAARLGVPLVGREDAGRWWALARAHAAELLAVYREQEPTLRRLYGELGASAYLPAGFGEFFCWYDHLAYAAAIDALAAAGKLVIPPERFAAAVWQEAPAASRF
jgi:DNA-binding transcriptional ArsR family regulator